MTRPSLAIALALALACGAPAAPKPAPEPPLPLAPITSLVPAAALRSLVVVRPKELYAHADLAPALSTLLPEDETLAFASRHGSIDPRQLDEIAVAAYPRATLVLARGVVDPARIEKSFSDRSLGIDGRAVDHAGDARTTLTRFWGEVSSGSGPTEHEEVATFGREAIGLEIGGERGTDGKPALGPLRASELFALRKLAKAKPALATTPLDAASGVLGDAPIRVFFAGPFEGEWASALGGLLRVATAVALAATPDGHAGFRVTAAILGAFGEQGPEAAQRLSAVVDVIAASAIGKLMGLDHPTAPFQARNTAEAAILEGSVDALSVARGARAVSGAQVAEIMKY